MELAEERCGLIAAKIGAGLVRVDTSRKLGHYCS